MGSAVDESNNPLTRWRREALRPDTQAAQFVSNIARLATPSKWLTAPLKAVGVLRNLDKVTDVARFASPDALKAVGLADNLTPGARGAIKAIENAPNRRVPFQVVAEAAKTSPDALAVKNRWQGVETQVATLKAGLGIGSGKKQWFKSAAEFVGWDLFMAYNVAGEGDKELDETLGDALQDWTGIGNPLATSWNDNALTLKLKQMGDALIGGVLIGGAIDLFRVQRYARNFSRATASEQRKILKLFEGQAEDIGVRVTSAYDRKMLPTSNITTRGGALAQQGGPEVDYPVWRQVIDDYSNRLEGARASQRQLAPGQPRLDGIDQVNVEVLQDALPGQAPGQPLLEGQFQLRGSEPVIEPPDWVAMAREAFANSSGSELQRVMTQLNDLLPQERLNLVDFIERIAPNPNQLNLLPAPEQFAVNRLLRQGVSEGWVEFDANFDPIIRRGRALEMDLGDIDAEAGRDFDEVLRLRRTKEEGQNNLIRQALDEMDERAVDELAVEEGVDADGLSMEGEYQRFLQEQPDGDVDAFRAWLQEQDQLEWFLNQSQRSGRVPPASQLDEIEVPGAEVPMDPRVGDVPETRPQAPDPLDAQIAEAEQVAEASSQRSNRALARAAQAEAEDASPAAAGDTVLNLGGAPIDPAAPTRELAARIEALKGVVREPRDVERLQWAQGKLLTDRKRANRLVKAAEAQAEEAKALQFQDDIVQLSPAEFKKKYPKVAAWEADEKTFTANVMDKGGKYVEGRFEVDPGKANSKAWLTLDKVKKGMEGAGTDYRLSQAGRDLVESRLKKRYGEWPGPTVPKPTQALKELEADQTAREIIAQVDQAAREEAVVQPLDDFMRQMDENGEICFP